MIGSGHYYQNAPLLIASVSILVVLDDWFGAVALYELDPFTVEMGEQDVYTLVQDYEHRQHIGWWQQYYSNGIVPLRLPKRRVYSEE